MTTACISLNQESNLNSDEVISENHSLKFLKSDQNFQDLEISTIDFGDLKIQGSSMPPIKINSENLWKSINQSCNSLNPENPD